MKLKKFFIIMFFSLFLIGCTMVEDMSYQDIINIFNNVPKKANVSRRGYKYYLPNGMESINRGDYYEILKSKKSYYYLYVDMISYINKLENQYEIDNKANYSDLIKIGDKYGYLEINLLENEKYLIEIMYNYAKIEVIVNSNDIASAITNSLIILTSVNYNDDIIDNLLEEDVLNYSEETFNIFETNSNDSNFLKVVEEYDNYNEDEVPDYDLIKEN